MKFIGKIETDTLKTIIQGICKVAYEPVIMIRNDGIRFSEADNPSAVCLYINAHVPKELFEKYEYEGDINIKIRGSILLNNFKSLTGPLMIGTDGERLKLKAIETGKTFDTRLLVVGDDVAKNKEIEDKIKTLDPPVSVRVNTDEFTGAITDVIKTFKKESVPLFTLKTASGGIKITAGDADGFNKFEQLIKVNVTLPEGHEANYKSDQADIIMSSALGETMSLGFGKDYPLIVDFENDGVTIRGVTLHMEG